MRVSCEVSSLGTGSWVEATASDEGSVHWHRLLCNKTFILATILIWYGCVYHPLSFIPHVFGLFSASFLLAWFSFKVVWDEVWLVHWASDIHVVEIKLPFWYFLVVLPELEAFKVFQIFVQIILQHFVSLLSVGNFAIILDNNCWPI